MKVSNISLSTDEATYIWSELDTVSKDIIIDAYRKAYKYRGTRHVSRTLEINNPKIIIANDHSNCRFDPNDAVMMDLLLTRIT